MFKFKTKLLSIFLIISIPFNSISIFADSSKDISVKNYKERQLCDLINPFHSGRDRRNKRNRSYIKDLMKLEMIDKMMEMEIITQGLDLQNDAMLYNKFVFFKSYMPLQIRLQEKILKVIGLSPYVNLKPVKIISLHEEVITERLADNILEFDDGLRYIDMQFEYKSEEVEKFLNNNQWLPKEIRRSIKEGCNKYTTGFNLLINTPLTIPIGKESMLEIPLSDEFQLIKIIRNGTDVTAKIVNEHELEFGSVEGEACVIALFKTGPAKDK